MNIKDVVNNNLCCCCGTCEGACPSNAIEFDFNGKTWEPYVDVFSCTNCGLCYDVCPAIRPKDDDGTILGKGIACFVAHSTNKQIRMNGSSGGVVTSILVYMLREKLIDGAIVLGASDDEPWHPEVKIAYTQKDIKSAAQSKYVLYPVNKIIKDVLKTDKTFAFVGIPCQVQGLKNAMEKNKLLKKRIKYIIGIFCGSNQQFLSTAYLVHKFSNKSYYDIETIKYRDGEHPGYLHITFSDGDDVRISKDKYGFVTRLFPNFRCHFCIDHTNELADISVGDAWGQGEEQSSYVIVRSKSMLSILDKAEIEKREIKPRDVAGGQYSMLYNKKVRAVARCSMEEDLFEKVFMFFDKILRKPWMIRFIFWMPLWFGRFVSWFMKQFNRIGIKQWRSSLLEM